jgi:hypothetical protein
LWAETALKLQRARPLERMELSGAAAHEKDDAVPLVVD